MDVDRPPDIVIIAAGDRAPSRALSDLPASCTVIAADGGVAHALEAGLAIDVAVGDFDSLAASVVDRLDDVAGRVERHPRDKDRTDLALAFDVALRSAPARVLVTGLEGGRPDHALANLLLAASAHLRALDIELALAAGRAWVVHRALTGRLPGGATISVVPVHGPADVTIDGCRWPLHHDHLEAGDTRGVSNECTDATFGLTVHAGTVLCITPQPQEQP